MEKITIILIAIGILLIVAGILWQFGIRLGKLPGDILIDKGNTKVFIPITSSIIVSIILSVLFYLINKANL